MRMAWFTVCLLAWPAALAQVPGRAGPEAQEQQPALAGTVQPGQSLLFAQQTNQFVRQTQPAPQKAWPLQPPGVFPFAKPKPMPPVAKMEPIPTQWPHAKFEPIPTRWLHAQVVQLGAQPAAGAVAVLPGRK